MIIGSALPIKVIGFPESAMTQEIAAAVIYEGRSTDIITPAEFDAMKSKSQHQYLVGFTQDRDERKRVIGVLTSLQCPTIVHDSCFVYSKDINKYVGRGTVISGFCSIMLHATIGEHCIFEPGCFIGHYSKLGNNVILHAGASIAGRVTINNNVEMMFKSSVLNKITVQDNVTVSAFSNLTKDTKAPGVYTGSVARYFGEK